MRSGRSVQEYYLLVLRWWKVQTTLKISPLVMQKVFQARGISEKGKTITSDNSPNVKAAVELLQVKPCFTTTLNLAMKDVIRNLDDVFATPNVKWRILLLCGTALLLLKKTNFVQD